MSRVRRRPALAAFLMLPGDETQRRWAPCTVAPWRWHRARPYHFSLVYARIRYQLAGLRQWIVAPALELLD